jgi:dolichol kinase
MGVVVGGRGSNLASDRSWRGGLAGFQARGFILAVVVLFFHEQRWLLLTQIQESVPQYIYDIRSLYIEYF